MTDIVSATCSKAGWRGRQFWTSWRSGKQARGNDAGVILFSLLVFTGFSLSTSMELSMQDPRTWPGAVESDVILNLWPVWAGPVTGHCSACTISKHSIANSFTKIVSVVPLIKRVQAAMASAHSCNLQWMVGLAVPHAKGRKQAPCSLLQFKHAPGQCSVAHELSHALKGQPSLPLLSPTRTSKGKTRPMLRSYVHTFPTQGLSLSTPLGSCTGAPSNGQSQQARSRTNAWHPQSRAYEHHQSLSRPAGCRGNLEHASIVACLQP